MNLCSSMSSCAGCSTNSKKDLDRWTSSLSNVLDSPRARKKFNDFLSHRRLDEAELTLHFWETCNRILLEASHNEQLKWVQITFPLCRDVSEGNCWGGWSIFQLLKTKIFEVFFMIWVGKNALNRVLYLPTSPGSTLRNEFTKIRKKLTFCMWKYGWPSWSTY